jgi:hypothetical protein
VDAESMVGPPATACHRRPRSHRRPPQPPPAGPPATAARGRRRSRDHLAAPPISKLHLRRSAAAPPIPLNSIAT